MTKCESPLGCGRESRRKHAFPVGQGFAGSLVYPADLLDHLPAIASEAFAGVLNVSVSAEIPTRATILDLGCGAGLDALIAARRVGPAGTGIAVDFSRDNVEQSSTDCSRGWRN